jgi:AraC-like DNA-binding protein
MSVPKQQITKAKLKNVIAASIKGGDATLPAVANRLAISRRSLQRQLALLGITYSELIDEVRQKMAKSLLATTNRSIAEIGAMLGYRDPSSFSRAFMRWSSMSPSDYRAISRPRGTARCTSNAVALVSLPARTVRRSPR